MKDIHNGTTTISPVMFFKNYQIRRINYSHVKSNIVAYKLPAYETEVEFVTVATLFVVMTSEYRALILQDTLAEY
jgi:hypothetical protein